jgi:4-amino-4-deoxychorismate lyase
MYPLFETIRIVNGVAQHPAWHESRMDRSRREYWPGCDPIELKNFLRVPPEYSAGIVRCRIIYGSQIGSISFEPYVMKPVRSLKLVKSDAIDYRFKFTDRTNLESLLSLKEDCDEILIVKGGLVTDTSISNIVFFDGNTWHTPDSPLLKGTCRERLLSSGSIDESRITTENIRRFSGCKMINAMRLPEEQEMIMISHIFD